VSRIAAYLGASALAGYATVQILGRRAGSTSAERAARMPGDELVPSPQMVTNHAVTIGARPEQIWPWLTQMGWHLGGYYTQQWVDRLMFPTNWSSLDHLDPNLVRDLQVGDTIPDGPPGTAQYVVHEVEAPRLLVLTSTSHIPPGWDEKYNARINWTWSFTLTSVSDGSTRVHSRVRGRMSPRWFAAFYVGTIVPADFVMATGMLRGLKKRAEAGTPPEISGRAPLAADS
jgi:hypothetical protein